MFSRITCPSCQYKFTVPESEMGKRQVCPNCQSPFFAGKSVADGAPVSMSKQAAPEGAFNKTMLADEGAAAPPIKYNCPRCKAALESPVAEGGTKKPCPACGQRLQVPNAPPPPAPAAPNLNKTMLAGDDSAAAPPIKYNCPACKKPLEAPAIEAGTKKPCSACGQRHQVPNAPSPRNPNKTMLVSDGGFGTPGNAESGGSATTPSTQQAPAANPTKTYALIGFGAVVLLMLGWIGAAVSRGGKFEDPAAAAQIAELKRTLDAMIAEKSKSLEDQKKKETELQKQRDDDEKRFRAQQDEIERRQRLARDNEAFLKDQKAKSDYEAKIAEDMRKLEAAKKDAEDRRERDALETRAQIEKLRNEVSAAKKEQAAVIAAPPVVVYPPYHPRYYWW